MKRKLTAAEKEQKKLNRHKYMYIFINGRQKRVERPKMINDSGIEQGIDLIFLHQEEQWDTIETNRDRWEI